MILSIVIALSLALLTWLYRHARYFKRVNLPYVKCIPILGSFFNLKGFYETVRLLYNNPDVKGKPVFGIFNFHKPALMVCDPELIKRITVKDFNSFSDRYASSNDHDTLGNNGLFASKNPKWKHMRSKMTPFFSSAKMKMMYYLMDKTSSDLIAHITEKLDEDGKVELEMKSLSALYSTDNIANCVFGIDANSLKNPDGEFRKAGQSCFNMTLYRTIEFGSFFMIPQITKLFGFTMFSIPTTKFMMTSIPEVMDERIRSGSKRHDLIDMFIELEREESTPREILIAQAAMFLAAGEDFLLQI
jgi:cytochrome P450 family 6